MGKVFAYIYLENGLYPRYVRNSENLKVNSSNIKHKKSKTSKTYRWLTGTKNAHYYRNANKNENETVFYTRENGLYIKKPRDNSCL